MKYVLQLHASRYKPRGPQKDRVIPSTTYHASIRDVVRYVWANRKRSTTMYTEHKSYIPFEGKNYSHDGWVVLRQKGKGYKPMNWKPFSFDDLIDLGPFSFEHHTRKGRRKHALLTSEEKWDISVVLKDILKRAVHKMESLEGQKNHADNTIEQLVAVRDAQEALLVENNLPEVVFFHGSDGPSMIERRQS